MIEVKNITKSFEGRPVLKNISTVFEDGKTNLIIGRSGSGKTVMIKNIIGLMRPDSGQILYDGRDLTLMNKEDLKILRKEMGMLFQGSALFDSMTVLENVMFPLDMFSKASTKERQMRAEFCLDRVNLPVGSRPSLSVGNQWRYDETSRYCPCHRLKPEVSVLRRTQFRSRP